MVDITFKLCPSTNPITATYTTVLHVCKQQHTSFTYFSWYLKPPHPLTLSLSGRSESLCKSNTSFLSSQIMIIFAECFTACWYSYNFSLVIMSSVSSGQFTFPVSPLVDQLPLSLGQEATQPSATFENKGEVPFTSVGSYCLVANNGDIFVCDS